MVNIIARKPRSTDGEYAVIDRGINYEHRYVSAIITEQSLKWSEWFWGNYFETKDDAIAHFNSRGK